MLHTIVSIPLQIHIHIHIHIPTPTALHPPTPTHPYQHTCTPIPTPLHPHLYTPPPHAEEQPREHSRRAASGGAVHATSAQQQHRYRTGHDRPVEVCLQCIRSDHMVSSREGHTVSLRGSHG